MKKTGSFKEAFSVTVWGVGELLDLQIYRVNLGAELLKSSHFTLYIWNLEVQDGKMISTLISKVLTWEAR